MAGGLPARKVFFGKIRFARLQAGLLGLAGYFLLRILRARRILTARYQCGHCSATGGNGRTERIANILIICDRQNQRHLAGLGQGNALSDQPGGIN